MYRIKNKMVSVVVPNYNNERYLEACLSSIICQSYSNIEVLVIDDSSTDNSVKIIEKYTEIDNRIILIRNLKNIGVAPSRDIGIKASTGRWITTLDSDDVYLNQDKLKNEVLTAERGEGDGFEPIVFSGIVLIDADGNKIGHQPGRLEEGDVLLKLMKRSCMIPRDFIFTKEQYIIAGGYDYTIPIYEDWDLKIRLASKYPYFYSGIDGIGYRRHGSGLSAVSPVVHARWLHTVFIKNRQLMKESRLKTAFVFYSYLIKMIFRNIF